MNISSIALFTMNANSQRMTFSKCSLIWLAVFAGTLAVGFPFCIPRAVRIEVRLGAPVPDGIQVYYRDKPTENFSQEKCVPARIKGVPVVANVDITVNQLYGLRIDFGSAPGEVSILGGNVGDIPLPPWKYWSFSSDVTLKSDVRESGELKLFSNGRDPNMAVAFRRAIPSRRTFNRQSFTLLLSLSFAVAVTTACAYRRRTERACPQEGENCVRSETLFIGLTMTELAFLLFCAVYYTLWIFQPFNFSPDEAMRFEVTRFIFEHGRLPVGAEVVNKTIGFGYAHIPTMFCNVFGAGFMRIGALFTSNATILLHAARMLGVFCILGTVYWTLRASKLLFERPFDWLYVCLVALLPQFASIGGYINNDSAALMGSSMILFAWVSAIDGRWTYRNATVQALGIAVCAMSYYNSYAWILCSLLMYPLTYYARNGKAGMFKMGLYIALVAFCLGSYLFIRHLYLYGDLLGFATIKRFAAQYAAPNYLPGVRQSLRDKGCSLADMLFKMDWIIWSARSFIGMFGKMLFKIPKWCYSAYAIVFASGVLGALWKGICWIRNWRRVGVCKWALVFSLLACGGITIGLSVRYSYTWDFQPQGRYCFPALLPIATLSAKGIEKIVSGTVARKIKNMVVLAICLLLGLVTEASYLYFRGLFY